MKLTIYNTAVKMESQEQCDRMKALLIENKLPIWDEKIAFKTFFQADYFVYHKSFNEFFVVNERILKNQTIITEQEFINLLKQAK